MHSETEEKVSKTLSIAGFDPRLLFGQNHSHLRLIEKSFDPTPTTSDNGSIYTWDLGNIYVGEKVTISFDIQSNE